MLDPTWTLQPGTLADAAKIAFQGAMEASVDGPLDGPLEHDGRWISATLFISGSWSGLLRLDLPQEQAARITAQWLPQESEAVQRSVVHDAAGELVNTMAGIIKPCLPGLRLMSVPRVCETDNALVIKGKKDILGATLGWEGFLFQLSLWRCPPAYGLPLVPKPSGVTANR